MYVRGSPRSSKQDLVGSSGVQSPSPTKSSSSGRVTPVSHNTSVVLSPSRTHRRGSNQGSRSGSPLTLPMDSYTCNLTGHGQAYLSESLHSSTPSPSRTPYQSPSHSRSSSVSSVRSLLSATRERPSEKLERDHFQQFQQQLTSLARDRSLDRQMDRQHREGERHPHGHALQPRDRSLEREYPFMGARSLDRDHPQIGGLLSRSRSIDQNYLADQSFLSVHDHAAKHHRDTLILDLQAQVAELNKECNSYQQELNSTKEKLSSNMNSIKTFWSPELKKERSLRKEECAKYTVLSEQLKIAQAENQKQSRAIHILEEDMRHLQNGKTNGLSPETETLKREKARQAKEVVILRKTVEEMELRIESQKQTLNSRDESIKKLLEMLKSKGLTVKHIEDDRMEQERMRTTIVEEERRIMQLEGILEQRDLEISVLKEELMKKSLAQFNPVGQGDNADTAEALQAIIETKDSRVAGLERELKCLEDEMLRLREEGAYRDDGSLQMESAKSQERILKTKNENLKMELSKKESELYALRTKQETLERQQSDNQQHIIVLRESVSAKERHCTMLQTDIEDLRHRLREKDEVIDKKANQVASVQQERKRVENEMSEVREHMEIKERKINVLHRKMENLDEVLKDKEEQLAAAKSRLASVSADQNSSDSVVSSLEACMAEKDKQIERLKDKCERNEKEHQEELEHYQTVTRDFKTRHDNLQSDADEKQNAILEMREEIADLKSERKKRESQIKHLEMQLSQKTAELSELEIKLKKIQKEQSDLSNQHAEETASAITELKQQMSAEKESVQKTQSEVDRLLDILKEMEDEKHQKDTLIKEAQEQIKDLKQKLGTMKRNHQTEKKKNANLLEEARKREGAVNEDASQLKNVINHKDERIEDLEEALKESVKITAEREMVVAHQQTELDNKDKKVHDLVSEVEKLRKSNSESTGKMNGLLRKLEEKDAQMQSLQVSRKKQLEEVYEMKQEALLAAISEKDAHIALLEMTSTKKQKTTDEVAKVTHEKNKLQAQLKQLTERRMKLLQAEDKNGQNDHSLAKQLQNSSSEQVIQAIRRIEHGKKRLALLIDQLVAACLDIDSQLLEGLPRTQLDQNNARLDGLRDVPHKQLLLELRQCERDSARLQDYANVLLQRIRDTQPRHLTSIFNFLDSTSAHQLAHQLHPHHHRSHHLDAPIPPHHHQIQHVPHSAPRHFKALDLFGASNNSSPGQNDKAQQHHCRNESSELIPDSDLGDLTTESDHSRVGNESCMFIPEEMCLLNPEIQKRQSHNGSVQKEDKSSSVINCGQKSHIKATQEPLKQSTSVEKQPLIPNSHNTQPKSFTKDELVLQKVPVPNGYLKACSQKHKSQSHIRPVVEPT